MGVNFTDNGDETSDCDVCGETIDNDHYGDMQAHDDEHRAEATRVAALPRTVIMYKNGAGYTVLEKASDGVYVVAVTTESYETARKVEQALA